MTAALWIGRAAVLGALAAVGRALYGALRSPAAGSDRGGGSGGGPPPDAKSVTKVRPAVMQPKSGNSVRAARIKTLGAMLQSLWREGSTSGQDLTPAGLELMLAQASAEGTGFGQGWDGDMAGSWNVGSYQVGNAPATTDYYRSVDHKDSRPLPGSGQKEYVTKFRYYVPGRGHTAAENGTLDFIKSITVKPFPAADEIQRGDLLDYALRQYRQHYFEGFNLSDEGQLVYAPSIAYVTARGVPVRRAGETEQGVAGRVVFYAAAMARSLPEIAAALGHDRVYASAPEDIVVPWKPSYQARTGNA